MKIIGWRKLGLGIGVLLATFLYLFWYTVETETGSIAPEIPASVRDIVLGIFFTFVGGNVASKVAKVKGRKE